MNPSSMRWLEILHLEIRLSDKLPGQFSQLPGSLDVGQIVLTEWKPVAGLERINSFGAIVKRVARLLTNKNIIHANEISLILCIEPVNHLYHVGVRDVTEGPPQSMLEKSRPTEGKIEPTVPRLSVERGHVVGVTIELVRVHA